MSGFGIGATKRVGRRQPELAFLPIPGRAGVGGHIRRVASALSDRMAYVICTSEICATSGVDAGGEITDSRTLASDNLVTPLIKRHEVA